MNLVKKAALLLFCSITLYSFPLHMGAALHSDGMLSTVTLAPIDQMADKLKVSFEAGPSWEINSDWRINDLMLRNSIVYSVYTYSIISITVQGAFEYRQIHAGLQTLHVPGASAGIGIEFDFGNALLSLNTGSQYLYSRNIQTYDGEYATVKYSEEWTAPYIWASIGYSYLL